MEGPPVSGEVPQRAIRERHVARATALVAEHRVRIEWSDDQLRDERQRALRALLAVAIERSAWHRRRLAGVDVASVTEADLEHLPVMTKSDLMDNFDDIVTDSRLTRDQCERHLDQVADPYLLDDYHVIASGGSSGQRGVFVYGWDAWATCHASIVRFQERDWDTDPALVGVPRVTAAVAASKPSHLSAAIGRTFSTPDRPRHAIPVSRPLEQIVDDLNDLQPTVLMGYSSFLPHLAAEARHGRLRIAPRRVIAISEPLLPEGRAAIEEAWGAPVAIGYGMSEGLVAGACRHGTHLPDDLCLVEPVDAAGRSVPVGQTSQRVYVTNLYNPVLPLIRFEVTDELTVLADPCPCGCAMRRIADPEGRLDELFRYAGGVTVHPHVVRSVLGHHPQIVEYQVRQTVDGADIRVVVDGELDLEAVARAIEAGVADVGLANPSIGIVMATSLGREPSGKLKRFVPLDS